MITSLTYSSIYGGRYRISYASDSTSDPIVYYVYVDGVLSYQGTKTFYDLKSTQAVEVEVFDDSTSAPVIQYPRELWLQWEHTPDAKTYYVIDVDTTSTLGFLRDDDKFIQKIKLTDLTPCTNYTVRYYRDWETDRKSTRLNSSHRSLSRMPSSA